MTTVWFLTAVLVAPCTLGLPLAVHPTLRPLSLPARLALAWAVGSLALTAVLTLCSAVGLPWTPWLAFFLGAPAVVVTAWSVLRSPPTMKEPQRSRAPGVQSATAALMLVAAALLLAFAVGAATSADLSYFWGAKAVHFAIQRGLDFNLLRQPYMIHLHPNYPPLWPVLLGWGAMVARDMPWLVVPSLTWLCLIVGATVVFSVLSSRCGSSAAAVTCLWLAVLGVMMVESFSGGNGDGPLVLFLSIALVTILTENEDGPRPLRWVAAVALAGAVFTKSEGMVAAILVAIGTAARDLVWRRRPVALPTLALVAPALAAAGLWLAVRIAHGLPLTDPIRESAFHVSFDHMGLIARISARILTSGVVAVAWLVPLIALLVAGYRRVTLALPAIVTALGIPLFAAVYYLHAQGDPRELMVWTLPRLIQPAISAWILGLGVATFPAAGERDRSTVHVQRP